MRGYDRHQVDEHIRQIETEVRQHREQTQGLRQQLVAVAESMEILEGDDRAVAVHGDVQQPRAVLDPDRGLDL